MLNTVGEVHFAKKITLLEIVYQNCTFTSFLTFLQKKNVHFTCVHALCNTCFSWVELSICFFYVDYVTSSLTNTIVIWIKQIGNVCVSLSAIICCFQRSHVYEKDCLRHQFTFLWLYTSLLIWFSQLWCLFCFRLQFNRLSGDILRGWI